MKKIVILLIGVCFVEAQSISQKLIDEAGGSVPTRPFSKDEQAKLKKLSKPLKHSAKKLNLSVINQPVSSRPTQPITCSKYVVPASNSIGCLAILSEEINIKCTNGNKPTYLRSYNDGCGDQSAQYEQQCKNIGSGWKWTGDVCSIDFSIPVYTGFGPVIDAGPGYFAGHIEEIPIVPATHYNLGHGPVINAGPNEWPRHKPIPTYAGQFANKPGHKPYPRIRTTDKV